MIDLKLVTIEDTDYVGTSKWLNDHYFKKMVLFIGKDSRGNPAIFLSKEDGSFKTRIAWVHNYPHTGLNWYNGNVCAHPAKTTKSRTGMFDYLTPPAEKAVQKFIDDCADILIEFLANDEETEIKIEKSELTLKIEQC